MEDNLIAETLIRLYNDTVAACGRWTVTCIRCRHEFEVTPTTLGSLQLNHIGPEKSVIGICEVCATKKDYLWENEILRKYT